MPSDGASLDRYQPTWNIIQFKDHSLNAGQPQSAFFGYLSASSIEPLIEVVQRFRQPQLFCAYLHVATVAQPLHNGHTTAPQRS